MGECATEAMFTHIFQEAKTKRRVWILISPSGVCLLPKTQSALMRIHFLNVPQPSQSAMVKIPPLSLKLSRSRAPKVCAGCSTAVREWLPLPCSGAGVSVQCEWHREVSSLPRVRTEAEASPTCRGSLCLAKTCDLRSVSALFIPSSESLYRHFWLINLKKSLESI